MANFLMAFKHGLLYFFHSKWFIRKLQTRSVHFWKLLSSCFNEKLVKSGRLSSKMTAQRFHKSSWTIFAGFFMLFLCLQFFVLFLSNWIYISVEKWYFNERNRRSTKSVFLCLCLDFIDMPFYQKESELLLVTRGWRLSPFGISFRFPFKLFFGLLKVESRLNIKCHFHERLISK